MIIAQAPINFASTAVAAGTSKQIVQVNSAGVTAGLTAGNFVLKVPTPLIADRSFSVVLQGYYNVVTTTTAAIGLSWSKDGGTTIADAFTAVASASLTGSAAPGTAYAFLVRQSFVASSLGSSNASAGNLSAILPSQYFVGAAAVTPVTIGTALTSVNYVGPNWTEPLTGLLPGTTPSQIAFAAQFTNGSSNTTADSTFVITNFYAFLD